MAQGIEVIYTLFNGLINLLFNDIIIVSGVSLGWVIITCIILSILFNSILNIPTGLISGAIAKKSKSERGGYDG